MPMIYFKKYAFVCRVPERRFEVYPFQQRYKRFKLPVESSANNDPSSARHKEGLQFVVI